MKRLQIPQKSACEVAALKKFYVHEIDAADLSIFLSKIYFLKNAKKTCKSDNRDLNRDRTRILGDS